MPKATSGCLSRGHGPFIKFVAQKLRKKQTTQSEHQAEGIEIMEIKEIVSVLDREFLPKCPRCTPCTSPTPTHPRPPDETFAAKHMPDLGYDVKEFRTFHWKLQDWRKLRKQLTSPEFDCGGHKWYGLPVHRHLYHSRNLSFPSGGYFSSRPEILTLTKTR